MTHTRNWAILLCLVFLVMMLAAGGQSQNVPAYAIGSIPTLTVYQGQQLKFTVQGPAPGMPLAVQLTPPPQGPATLDKTTGLFTYVPGANDTFEFLAVFSAGAGAPGGVTQTITIKPSPRLPPEYDLIQYRRPLPDENTGIYTNYSQAYSNTPTPLFNTHVNKNTREIEISGKTVTLDPRADTQRLLESILSPDWDIAKLTIYAETVIIRSSIKLPQTNVVIFARELIFQDPEGSPPGTANLDTRPLPYTASASPPDSSDPKRADGSPGLKAGDVILHIEHFTSTPARTGTTDVIRFLMPGGRGQNPGDGVNGRAGRSYPSFPFASTSPNGWSCTTGNTTRTVRSPLTLPAGTIFVQATCNGVTEYFPPNNSHPLCPESGTPPKPSGKPGSGGGGGNLTTSYDVTGTAVVDGGSSGTRGPNVTGGAGGTPTNAIWYDIFLGTVKRCPTTVSYPAVVAPAADSTFGTPGIKSTVTEPLYAWLHPYALRMILSWAKDAYRDGNLLDAQQVFRDYLPILTALASSPNGSQFVAAKLEVEQFLHRLDANLDYYGNPAGWVPLLSLETNMKLLNQEVDAAVPLIYLSERIGKIAENEAQRQQTLTETISRLRTEVKDAAADFANVQVTIRQLSLTAGILTQKVRQTQAEIIDREASLTARAQQSVADAHKVPEWKMGLRILSAACQILPVYQPVLGAVGAGLNLITNIDTNQPLDTLQQGYAIGQQFNDAAFAKSQQQLDDMLKALNPNSTGSVADYVKNAGPVLTNLTQGINQFRKTIQDKGVAQNEVDAELSKLRAQDYVYNDLIATIEDLNGQKTANAQAMSKALDQLTRDTETINADLNSIQDFQRAYSESVRRLDHSTVVYMRDMERRQLDRLQKYLYYMAKAYEYRLVKPYTGKLGLDKVMQKLREMLSSNGNALTQADIESVIGVYREELRAVIEAGIDELQKKPPEKTVQLRFGLTTDQLNTLNTNGAVTINLDDVIPGLPNEENRRLATLGILPPDDGGISVSAATASLVTGNIRIVIEHFGQSTLTSGGQRYLFRFGSPGFEKPFSWGASYDLVDRSFSPETFSLAGLSLLDAFLDRPSSLQTLQQFVEPSAESRITISRVVTQGVTANITRLRLFAQVDFYRGDNAQKTLSVQAAAAGQPYIAINQKDLNNRAGGVGTFRRVYPAGTAVTLNAEPTYAGQKFLKWVDQNNNTLSATPSLSVTLSTARVVQTVYEGRAEDPTGTRFSILNRGATSLLTSGSAAVTSSGYARIQPDGGSRTPSGLAIFGFRNRGVLVSEAGVPDSPLMTAGRIYAEISADGIVNTGIAIANPNSQAAAIAFAFADSAGVTFRTGSTSIGANGQIAYFLDGSNGSPFNAGRGIQGTFSFSSSVPVSVIALRGFNNERGEFLMTTLPVIDTMLTPNAGTQFLPQFADGQGWTTQILLVNPTSSERLTGTVQFFGPGSPTSPGVLSPVMVNGTLTGTVSYSVAGNSAQKVQTSGTSPALTTGSVRIVPAGGGVAPTPLVVYSYKPGTVTVSEAGVQANTDTSFRMYVESAGTAGQPGNIQSGIAIANTTTTSITVACELLDFQGALIAPSSTIAIPASGQISRYLSDIFSSLPQDFRGVLRINSPSAIAVVGLRARYNERRDFLITTTPPVNENSAAVTSARFFPQVADGGGYTTQFILLGSQSGQGASGRLQLFSQSGQTLDGSLR